MVGVITHLRASCILFRHGGVELHDCCPTLLLQMTAAVQGWPRMVAGTHIVAPAHVVLCSHTHLISS
jgi:hypothetical protein